MAEASRLIKKRLDVEQIFEYPRGMAPSREKYASQADPDLLREMRALASSEGRHFQAVMEDAMREYLERKKTASPRDDVMARFRASVERNRRLGELLAK